MAALLELRGVCKSYGAVQALDGVSFDVSEGEIVALVGENGAGKSTTAKIIAGALRADAGALLLDGSERSWASPRDAQIAGIEMVYQDMGLAPHLSVAANIYLGREIRRGGVLGRLGFVDRDAMSEGAGAVLAQLKVNVPQGNYPSAQLSGGQRQAVAIAKSLRWTNRLLILDEPTNHLGVRGSNQVLELIRQIRDQGVGVILVSHTIPQVLDVADRIVVFWQGKVGAVMPARGATVEQVVAEITGASGWTRRISDA